MWWWRQHRFDSRIHSPMEHPIVKHLNRFHRIEKPHRWRQQYINLIFSYSFSFYCRWSNRRVEKQHIVIAFGYTNRQCHQWRVRTGMCSIHINLLPFELDILGIQVKLCKNRKVIELNKYRKKFDRKMVNHRFIVAGLYLSFVLEISPSAWGDAASVYSVCSHNNK